MKRYISESLEFSVVATMLKNRIHIIHIDGKKSQEKIRIIVNFLIIKISN